MSGPRRAALASLLAAVASLGLPGVGCGTDAVGVDDCRAIERARCRAAASCPAPAGIDDVAACERFYRDQCLHGLDLDTAPPKSAVSACVAAIEAAGRCAATDPDQSIADCDDPDLAPARAVDSTLGVCVALEEPELTDACAFLTPEAASGAAGAAGAAGAETAGAAGAEAAAGAAGAEAEGSGTAGASGSAGAGGAGAE